MIGAKLPFALADWPGLLSGRAWLENGKTIVFGMVGGYLGVELAKAILGVRVKTGDGFAVPVAGAVAVGRLSCFAAGCCHGVATGLPWGVDFGDGIRRHPTQLYEMAFHASAALVLAGLQRRGLFRGQLIKLYILAYLAYRFVDRVPPPRAGPGPGPDRLPVGVPGAGPGVRRALDRGTAGAPAGRGRAGGLRPAGPVRVAIGQ